MKPLFSHFYTIPIKTGYGIAGYARSFYSGPIGEWKNGIYKKVRPSDHDRYFGVSMSGIVDKVEKASGK